MPLATREQLLKPAERRYLNIPLPVSGLAVRIQSLREGEKTAYETDVSLTEDGERRPVRERLEDAKVMLICRVLVDAEGKRLLEDDDFDALSEMDGLDAATIYDAAFKHCGFEPTDVENLVKNSEKVRAV